MAKKRKVKNKVPMSVEEKEKLCESCLKIGKKIVMTQRDPQTLECPKCYSHKPKKTVEEKTATETENERLKEENERLKTNALLETENAQLKKEMEELKKKQK